MENRIESLRAHILRLAKEKTQGEFWMLWNHMYAVSNLAAMLAQKRSLDPELGIIIGLLHDIQTLLTGNHQDHARLGAQRAGEILNELNICSTEEVQTICRAIDNHSSKAVVHDPYSELIKDADVLSHYFHNTTLPVAAHERHRLDTLLGEWGISTVIN